MELFRNPIIFKHELKEEFKRKLAIVPASSGCGASFVCGQFAMGNYSKSNIIEMGKPYFYLALNMKKSITERDVVFYEEHIKKRGAAFCENKLMDINWFVRKPGSGTADFSVLSMLAKYPPDGISFYDFSGCKPDVIMELLPEMDEIYVVIDPLPSKLLESAAFLEELKLRFPSSIYIVNKMNKGVHKNELKRFLGNSETREIPCYPAEKIYRAEYNCVLPNLN